MALPAQRGTFTFNHADQVDEYGKSVGDAAVIQINFDSRAQENLVDVNAIIAALVSETVGDSGAHSVKSAPVTGASGSDVHTIMQSLADSIASAILGQIPDDSLTNAKLAADIKIGSLALLNTVIKTSVVNAINEVVADVALKALLASNTESITFDEQVITSSGGAATIDWDNGNKATITLTEDTALTFTDPSDACNVQLRIVQDVTGGWEFTYPASVIWVGENETQPSVLGGAKDILSMYYDGTNYYAVMSKNFG